MADDKRPGLDAEIPEWRGRTPIPKLVEEQLPDDQAGLTPIPKHVPTDIKPIKDKPDK